MLSYLTVMLKAVNYASETYLTLQNTENGLWQNRQNILLIGILKKKSWHYVVENRIPMRYSSIDV